MSKESGKWTLSRIQRMINDKVKESPYLDYKRSDALFVQNGGKLKTEFSKDVSAFANAGGGVIIYGVIEESHLPKEIDDGFDPLKMARESLDQLISSTIHPNIEGIQIHQIDIGKDNRVIYVVEIPQSDRAPHQAADKRFYARRNFISEPMEEYEIRDVFMRKKAPSVVLDFYLRRFEARIEQFPLSIKDPDTWHNVELNASLTNEGGGEIHYTTIRLYFDARLIPEEDKLKYHFSFAQRILVIEGIEIATLKTDINWGDSSRMPLFKTVEYLLFRRDISIHFKPSWLREEHSPFILWEVRAPGMEPNRGFLALRLDGSKLVLRRENIPKITDILQDGRNRDFLRNPDLSFHPQID